MINSCYLQPLPAIFSYKMEPNHLMTGVTCARLNFQSELANNIAGHTWLLIVWTLHNSSQVKEFGGRDRLFDSQGHVSMYSRVFVNTKFAPAYIKL